ncbi:MAG: hypothetical protein HDR95_00700 [Bacteroides sp.]|nr:hypothetical protein [Bacteroides sp.]
MKRYHIFCVMLLALCVLVGCDDNEPVAPVNPDKPIEQPGGDNNDNEYPDVNEPGDLNAGYSQEEIAATLPGAWVTFDENNNWNRIDFTNGEDDQLTYVWLSAEGPAPEKGLVASRGKWQFSDSTRPVTSVALIPEFDQLQTSALLVIPTSLTEMEITWQQTDYTCGVRSDGKTLTLNRIITSVFATPGTEVDVLIKDILKNKVYTILDSPDPSVATIDKSSSKVNVTGYGTIYIPVQSNEGTGYIEVTGSPLIKMPINISDFIGMRSHYDEDTEISSWEGDVSPLLEEYPGISNIKYFTELGGNTWSYIYSIKVYPDPKISGYAMWLIANQEWKFRSATKEFLNFSPFHVYPNIWAHELIVVFDRSKNFETPYFEYTYEDDDY